MKPTRFVISIAIGALAGCAPTVVAIHELSSPTPPEWNEKADPHRPIAGLTRRWLDRARPVASLQSLAASLDIEPGVVIFIGEDHNQRRWSQALTREILNRRSFTLWEEGRTLQGLGGDRLEGLYTGRRKGDAGPEPEHSVVAGGAGFNRAFAKRIAAGRPERLLVYAGNAHVVHVPILQGADPFTGRPLPYDVASQSGARVFAIAVCPREEWLDWIDMTMMQALACALSSGRLTPEQAQAEIRWGLEFLDEARRDAVGIGTFVVGADPAEAAPSRFLLVVNDDARYWLLGPMHSLGRVLEHEDFRASEGETEVKLEYVMRSLLNPSSRRTEELLFLLSRPESGRKVRFKVTPENVQTTKSSPKK